MFFKFIGQHSSVPLKRGVRVPIESVNLRLSFPRLAGAFRSSSRNPAVRIASK
jgi:hypothetical protein